ncbi:thioredoxin [Candidatus Saccharibacteria bacterium]|nr:thioredoxin [Candidatus Saccharibacteria bacterium]
MALYTTISQSEFEQKVLQNSKLVLVDFWAQWCPPCRAMAPSLESLAKKMDSDLDVVKVDVEASSDNGSLAQKHGVQGIPNMQIFKDGKVVDVLVGLRPEAVLEEELRSHLK